MTEDPQIRKWFDAAADAPVSDERLRAYINGDLSESEDACMRAHLRRHPETRDRLAEILLPADESYAFALRIEFPEVATARAAAASNIHEHRIEIDGVPATCKLLVRKDAREVVITVRAETESLLGAAVEIAHPSLTEGSILLQFEPFPGGGVVAAKTVILDRTAFDSFVRSLSSKPGVRLE